MTDPQNTISYAAAIRSDGWIVASQATPDEARRSQAILQGTLAERAKAHMADAR